MNRQKNIPASVRQRLLNRAKEEERSFQELLQYYGMERFLYRLSVSPFRDRFVLKGALMLQVWDSPEKRPTKDIDFLGRTDNSTENIESLMRQIIRTDVPEDGVTMDADTVRSERISEDTDYTGIRVRFEGNLDGARISFQIDIGFDDIVYPDIEESRLPTILDFPSPSLLCYSRESAIAEKYEAMVKLGRLNSRMKDFFDIWLLSRQFEFSGAILQTAIRKTFENRETPLPKTPSFTNPRFVTEKQIQWKAFRKRMKQEYIPEDFLEITEHLAVFLKPFVAASETDDISNWVWNKKRWSSI